MGWLSDLSAVASAIIAAAVLRIEWRNYKDRQPSLDISVTWLPPDGGRPLPRLHIELLNRRAATVKIHGVWFERDVTGTFDVANIVKRIPVTKDVFTSVKSDCECSIDGEGNWSATLGQHDRITLNFIESSPKWDKSVPGFDRGDGKTSICVATSHRTKLYRKKLGKVPSSY